MAGSNTFGGTIKLLSTFPNDASELLSQRTLWCLTRDCINARINLVFQFYAVLVQLRRKRPAYNIKNKGCENVSTLQIQTVLFNNEKSALLKSLDSIKRALEVSTFHTKEFNMARVCYGDASPVRLFSGEKINELNQKYGKVFSLSYTYFDCNTGTSKGHNLLAKNCEMDYLVIMNPDVIFSPRFLIEVMKLFHDENLNAGIVEGRQTPIEHPKDYDKKNWRDLMELRGVFCYKDRDFSSSWRL